MFGKKQFRLCNVQVSRFKKQSVEVKSAMRSLDDQIRELQTKIAESSGYYIQTNDGKEDYNVIRGALKFLYMADILTSLEYRMILEGVDVSPRRSLCVIDEYDDEIGGAI